MDDDVEDLGDDQATGRHKEGEGQVQLMILCIAMTSAPWYTCKGQGVGEDCTIEIRI
jgi:hypothetical protein